jgi:hypothetical protein
LLQLLKQFVQIVWYVHGPTPKNPTTHRNTIHSDMLRECLEDTGLA